MIEDRAIQVLRNIPKSAVATYRHQKEVALDSLVERAIKSIQIISRIDTPKEDRRTKIDAYMREAWVIYRELLGMYDKIPQKYLDNSHHFPLRVQSMNHRFSGINWKSIGAPPKGHKAVNLYWNEAEARKKRPVKIYTKSERERFWK